VRMRSRLRSLANEDGQQSGLVSPKMGRISRFRAEMSVRTDEGETLAADNSG